jgi:hypothetical protein
LILLIIVLIFLFTFVMKKIDFEQMVVINGGQEISNYEEEDGAVFRPCVVGKWITGIGLVAIAVGIPFTCGAAAIAYGVIAGATTIAC